MSLIGRIRTAVTGIAAPLTQSHPYIDTPDFSYDGWLNHLRGKAIGKVEDKPKVAVIGAGASGLCAAYELACAGCQVSVFEAAAVAGGRCASTPFTNDNPDLAEMGAMRFPPSEFTLSYYLIKFGLTDTYGIDGLPDFPDPGVVKTFICYGDGEPIKWQASDGAPTGFETVYNGWHAFCKEGITKDSDPVFQSPVAITAALTKGKVDLATTYWQNYITRFGQISFYSFLYQLFTGQSGYDIPGRKPWSFNDFDRFGALGIGSGGFGSLYPIGFTDIFRLLPNELESTQKFLKAGIRSLPNAFAHALKGKATFHYQTPIQTIAGNKHSGFELYSGNAKYGNFKRIVMATTTRSMEMTTNLTEAKILSSKVKRAIRRTHVVASVKIAARIKRFWKKDDPSDQTIRCLLSDDALHQVYTLDYGADDTGVCFLSYTWDDDAVKQQALGVSHSGGEVDKTTLYQSLLTMLTQNGGEIAEWAKHLQPYGDPETSIVFVEWQSNPHFNGAYKLSEPGQDPYVQDMFYDFQKASDKERDDGLYIAGDCIAWTSGWVEGALQTGLNAAAGVVSSLGGQLHGDANDKTPLDIKPNRFDYFGAK